MMPAARCMEELCIVCNDEGRLGGMQPNRAVRNEDRKTKSLTVS